MGDKGAVFKEVRRRKRIEIQEALPAEARGLQFRVIACDEREVKIFLKKQEFLGKNLGQSKISGSIRQIADVLSGMVGVNAVEKS